MSSNPAFFENTAAAALANCYQAKTIYYAVSIHAMRERYTAGPIERKTAARSAAFLEAQRLKNSASRLFSWYCAAALAGYRGIAVTSEDIAENAAAATGCKMSARTVSRVNSELSRAGWIILRPLPTGNAIERPGGGWITKRINQVIFSPFLLRLCGLSHISRPSPKRRAMVLREKPGRSFDRSGPVISPEQSKIETFTPAPVVPTVEAVEPTSGPPTAAHVGQCSVQKPASGRKTAEKAVCTSGAGSAVAAVPHGRTDRNRRPRSWSALATLFLRELEAETAGLSPDIRTAVSNFARVHTSLSLPPLISSPIDWNRLIWTYAELDWKPRRARLRAVTIPALIAAVAAMVPPDRSRCTNPLIHPDDRKRARESCAQWDRLSAWSMSISGDIINGDYPAAAKDFARAHQWELDQWTALIQKSLVPPEQIDPDISRLFRTLADMIGAD